MAHMRNMAFRHRRAARKMSAKLGPEVHDYEITDPAHRPDLRGELAGAKVRQQDNKQIVTLSPKAAQFYLDSGSIRPLQQPKQKSEEVKSASFHVGNGGKGASSQSDPARVGYFIKD